MKVKKREVVETVYEADDGTPFLKEDECKAYEEALKDTKVFRIHYCPDTTEHGTLQKTLLLFVKAKFSHELWAELWCEKGFGSRLDFVQGVAICTAWRVGIQEALTDALRKEKDKDGLLEVVRIDGGDTTLPDWVKGRPRIPGDM